MIRHNKFPDIPKLDNELDLISQNVETLNGKYVKEFPPLSQVPEYTRFFKKVSEGTYQEYIKIQSAYRLLGGGGSGGGSWTYIAYADDDSGTGFTLTFDAGKDYIAILISNEEITSPVAGNFIGLWKMYKGADGADGQSIDHTSFTSSTGGGVAGVAGETDTYTVWGDAGETISLGTFQVYNGADGSGGSMAMLMSLAIMGMGFPALLFTGAITIAG